MERIGPTTRRTARRRPSGEVLRLGLLARSALAVACATLPVLGRLGVDRGAFRVLLATKLALDERRGRRSHTMAEGSDRGLMTRGLLLSCGSNLLLGLFGGIAVLTIGDPLLGMGVCQTLILTMTSLVLVGDYSSVLLDDTDIAVVAPLPVDDRTFFVARVAHVAVYLGLVSGSLAVMPLVLGCLRYPPLVFVPVFAVSTLCSVVLAVTLALGIFVAAARLLDAERFKDAILALQIGSMVVLTGGFQLLPQLLAGKDVVGWMHQHRWLQIALPPLHQGGLLALALGDRGGDHVVLGVLAVVLPALAALLLMWLSGRGFLSGLASRAVAARSARRPRRVPGRWSHWLLPEDEARAGYAFGRALARRDRGFRMRAYPALAMSLVLGVVFGLRDGGRHVPAMLCGAIYFVGLQGPAMVFLSRFSDTWEARWVLQSMPMARPGAFVGGAMTALLTTLLLPLLVILAVGIVAIGGAAIAVDVVFAFFVSLSMTLLGMRVLARELPFTRKPSREAQEGRTATMLVLSALIGVAVVVHVGLRLLPWGLPIGAAGLAALSLWLLLALRRLPVRPPVW